MTTAFKILVCICGLIVILAGANDVWKGASAEGDFGDLGEHVTGPMLNFTIRFLGTVLAGFGVLMILFATNLERYRPPLMVALSVVILGGLGRVGSIIQHGTAPGHEVTMYSILGVELILVPALLVWLVLAGERMY